jgi:hypothetical protein
VAQVTRLFAQDGQPHVSVRWFYRPEELHCGRRAAHGTNEVFASGTYSALSINVPASSLKLLPFSADYLNDNLVDTIVAKCQVRMLETAHEAAKYVFGFAYDIDTTPNRCFLILPGGIHRRRRKGSSSAVTTTLARTVLLTPLVAHVT